MNKKKEWKMLKNEEPKKKKMMTMIDVKEWKIA